MNRTFFWIFTLAFLVIGWWMNIFIIISLGSGVQSTEGYARVIGLIIAPIGGIMGYM